MTAAIRGKQALLFATLKDDFTGAHNFITWGIAIWIVTAIGFYKPLRPISHAFLVLVFVVLFLSHEGIIRKFMDQVRSTGVVPI